MTDENIEETKENPVEETAVEETPKPNPPEEKETPEIKTEEPKEEYTDREKRYYARMKKAEEDAKAAKAELIKSKAPISEIDAILEVQSATKELDPQEIAELKLRATAGKMSLSEARKDPNYLLWQDAYRAKVEKELSEKPSTLQPEVERPKDFIDEFKEAGAKPTVSLGGKMYIPADAHLDSIEKQAEILKKRGLWKDPRRRDASKRIPLSPTQ